MRQATGKSDRTAGRCASGNARVRRRGLAAVHGTLLASVLISLATLPEVAAAAEVRIEKLSGNSGCRARILPDRHAGRQIVLEFTTTNGKDVRIQARGGNRIELVAGDTRVRFRGISGQSTEAIRSNAAWRLMSMSRTFHLTARSSDGGNRSARFDGLDPRHILRRLHARCPPGPNVAELREAERKLGLDGTDIRILNWIIERELGSSIVPAQASGRLDDRARDRLERVSRRLTGEARRYIDQGLYVRLLELGGFRFPPLFDEAGNFDGGVAGVKQGTLWGLVAKNVDWVKRPAYDDMRGTSSGFVPVRRGSYWGIVDSKGRQTHPMRYEEILTCSQDRCPYRSGNRWGFLDPRGGVAIEARYRSVNRFREGHAAVRDAKGWALIDRSGRVTLRFRTDRLYSPSNGLMVFIDGDRRGFAALDGRVRVRARYDQVKAFTEGHGAVRRGGLWGFVDRGGREVIPPSYRSVGQFGDGLAPAQAKNGLWGYIDRRGRWAISPKFLRGFNFRSGIAIVRAPNPLKPGSTESADVLRGYIDKNGRWLYPPVFEDVYIFKEGLAPVKMLGRWGYLDLALLRRRK